MSKPLTGIEAHFLMVLRIITNRKLNLLAYAACHCYYHHSNLEATNNASQSRTTLTQ